VSAAPSALPTRLGHRIDADFGSLLVTICTCGGARVVTLRGSVGVFVLRADSAVLGMLRTVVDCAAVVVEKDQLVHASCTDAEAAQSEAREPEVVRL
jgi:hypothetical protein